MTSITYFSVANHIAGIICPNISANTLLEILNYYCLNKAVIHIEFLLVSIAYCPFLQHYSIIEILPNNKSICNYPYFHSLRAILYL